MQITANKSDTKIKNLPYRMDPENHRRLKVFCAQHGISMQSLMDKAVEEYLRKWAV